MAFLLDLSDQYLISIGEPRDAQRPDSDSRIQRYSENLLSDTLPEMTTQRVKGIMSVIGKEFVERFK